MMMGGLRVNVGRALVGRQRLCFTRTLSSSSALRKRLNMTRPGSFLRTLSAFDAFALQRPAPFASIAGRFFQSEAEFHPVADETLDVIQDVMEEIFKDISGDEEDVEVSVASGVLTLSLPPHGTWVINKQTPNRQLWWSSPISGPRRYEYQNGKWVYTRSGEGPSTLGAAIAKEIKELYNVDLEIDI